MRTRRGTPLPVELARMPVRVVRPRDAAGIYAHPRPEFARLVGAGVLHRVARGYFCVVPQEYVGRAWMPDLESVAVGIGAATFGVDGSVAMGVTAARIHGVIPRALATALVAVPRQHRPITLTDRVATVRFVARDTDSLDVERKETVLGSVLVTTPEQTLLDLLKRPTLGDAEVEVRAAVAALYRRSDRDHLERVAAEQRLAAALHRAEGMVGADGVGS